MAGTLLQVGTNLKRPEAPVFVLQSESHYSVLWAPGAAPDLELPSDDEKPADGMEGYGDDEFEADPDAASGHNGLAADGSAAAFRSAGDAPFNGEFDLCYFDQMAERDDAVRFTLRRAPEGHARIATARTCAPEGTEAVEAEHGTKRQRGIEAELGGVRRSKRVAERMEGGTEQDTEHAHRRKRHESASRSVPDGVTPWRDK